MSERRRVGLAVSYGGLASLVAGALAGAVVPQGARRQVGEYKPQHDAHVEAWWRWQDYRLALKRAQQRADERAAARREKDLPHIEAAEQKRARKNARRAELLKKASP
jgi:hypothetical protein